MRRLALLAVPAAVAALAVAGCGGGDSPTERAATTVTRTVTVAAPAASGTRSLADTVASVVPTVVDIRTRTYDGSREEGSGVVLDARGVIVTNDHVVQGARTVTVLVGIGAKRRSLRGQVIGASRGDDLAVVQVRRGGLTAARTGSSKAMRLGDPVVAIGFPLDLRGGPTVTQGIVSGLGRTVRAQDGPRLRGMLQTDAAINPGNSGGGLFDAEGRLVGINTVTTAGQAENVGFSIPIDSALPVVRRLRAGTTRGAWLGASFDDVASQSDAVQLGLAPEVRGAVASSVLADGPAARAGLTEGDVVVAVDGEKVASAKDLARATSSRKPGDRLALDVVDSAGPRRVTLTVGRRPATLAP